MTRNDYNLIAAVLFQAIRDGTASPAVTMRFVEAFVRRGDSQPDFLLQDFVDRCVEPKRRAELGSINPGRTAPPEKERPVQQAKQDDASLFTAIIATEFPELVGVNCTFSRNRAEVFSIGRVGTKVWIRFGSMAAHDPVAAVRKAAPDAALMMQGRSSAREIRG